MQKKVKNLIIVKFQQFYSISSKQHWRYRQQQQQSVLYIIYKSDSHSPQYFWPWFDLIPFQGTVVQLFEGTTSPKQKGRAPQNFTGPNIQYSDAPLVRKPPVQKTNVRKTNRSSPMDYSKQG